MITATSTYWDVNYYYYYFGIVLFQQYIVKSINMGGYVSSPNSYHLYCGWTIMLNLYQHALSWTMDNSNKTLSTKYVVLVHTGLIIIMIMIIIMVLTYFNKYIIKSTHMGGCMVPPRIRITCTRVWMLNLYGCISRGHALSWTVASNKTLSTKFIVLVRTVVNYYDYFGIVLFQQYITKSINMGGCMFPHRIRIIWTGVER